ncbi:MAG TPA: serine/threonine-protein kinase [Enhygromyxa sp.]|nr:serine/threonine-protein kinase [Enhygromyxa sp.]
MSGDLETLAGDSTSGDWRPEPEPLQLATGSTLGRYLVLERLGMGGMGVVYAAYDPQLDRKVAIKLVRPTSSHGSVGDVRTRLLREAQAMAKLSHPNVVAVHDVGTVDKQIFVAMEFIDGVTLRAWLDVEPRDWRAALACLREAGRGLAAAHAHGLVHRDFKPDNVMIGKHGRVVVMDFGLVRAEARELETESPSAEHRSTSELDAPFDSVLTQVGSLLGTPAYMAPEQLSGADVDPRSDQFSFCVTLYEALYGQRPFAGRTVAQLVTAILDGAIEPEPRGTAVPRWLRAVVVRGLATKPRDRFASMDELLAALGRDPSRRRRWLAVGGAVVLASAAAVGLGARASQLQEQRTLAECDAAGQAIEQVWSPSARASLERALLATASPFASTSYERMAAWLDPWAARWARERTEVCVRARVDEQLGADAYAQAVACFDEQRDHLAALLDAFASPEAKIDAQMVAGAAKAAASFSQLESCADERMVAQRPVVPATLANSPERAAVARSLARASALSDAGDYVHALALAREALASATMLGWDPLEAEARLLAASIHGELGDYEEVTRELRVAYRLAVSSGSDVIAARSSIMLLRVYGYQLARAREGLAWADVAEALLERLDRQASLDGAQLANDVALAHEVLGDFDESERWHMRALELRTRVLSADHPETGHSFGNLGNLALRRNDLDAALRWHQRALAVRRAGLGPSHPDVGRSHANIGRVQLARGQLDDALEHFHRSLEIFDAIFGRRHRVNARTLDGIGRAHRDRGEHALALEYLSQALDIQRESLGEQHPDTAQTLLDIGLLQIATGQLESAHASLRAAAAGFEAGLGVGHSFTVAVADAFARLCASGHAPAC